MLIAFEVKIELPVILLVGLPFKRLNEVSYAVCGECGHAKNTHNLNDRPADIEVMLDDGNEAVGDNGNVYRYAFQKCDKVFETYYIAHERVIFQFNEF